MPQTAASAVTPQTFVKGFHGIRYHVKDVARAVAFYTGQLGFKLEHQQLPAFAAVSLGGATLLLNSYGLIVGLWQLMHPNERFGSALERPELRILKRDYERDVEAALRALWTGSLGVKALKEKSP